MNLDMLPDVNFVEVDSEKIINEIVSNYENAHYEQTGKLIKLQQGDPIRIFLYAQALREIQLRNIINDTGRQNLLKYARGDMLEHLGTFKDKELTRLELKNAYTSQKFILSKVFDTDQRVPAGTKVGLEDNPDIYFEVFEELVIKAGEIEGIAKVECNQPGTVGNGFEPGEINKLMNTLPFIAKTENVDTTQGGIDREEDISYKERIWLAPEGFSVAGPEGAYEYIAKKFSANIEDIKVLSPSPGCIDIIVLLKDGEIPSETFLNELLEFVSDKNKRPLTDKVSTKAAEEVSYDIEITYYISEEHKTLEASIQEKVNQKIKEYKEWQKKKMGRDINPSKLHEEIMASGVKRVEIIQPVFQKVSGTQVAKLNLESITFGGIEEE